MRICIPWCILLICLAALSLAEEDFYWHPPPGDHQNKIADEDLAWMWYFDGFLSGELDNEYLLKHYGCAYFNEVDGIEEDSSAPNQKDESISSSEIEPYSTIPNADTWRLFEEAYFSALYLDLSRESSESLDHDALRGMRIPHEVLYEPGIGRGVHATTFVPKGTTVWTPSHTATFVNERHDAHIRFRMPAYRRFIQYLHEDYLSKKDENETAHNWVCDALMWTWVQYTIIQNRSMPHALCVAFDVGSMFNNAMEDDDAENLDDEPEAQMLVKKFEIEPFGLPLTTNLCTQRGLVAIRDILPGERKSCILGSFLYSIGGAGFVRCCHQLPLSSHLHHSLFHSLNHSTIRPIFLVSKELMYDYETEELF